VLQDSFNKTRSHIWTYEHSTAHTLTLELMLHPLLNTVLWPKNNNKAYPPTLFLNGMLDETDPSLRDVPVGWCSPASSVARPAARAHVPPTDQSATLHVQPITSQCLLHSKCPGHLFKKHLKSNVYVTLNAIGSFQCNPCSHWLIFIT